ncbi:MAG: right-handed parallel beta-helix repeat-containing protein [Capsulimonadales bacterium]|nr:right-handed parallel beta-helix repeat-containing protein [Capsulimonadales bacterium]
MSICFGALAALLLIMEGSVMGRNPSTGADRAPIFYVATNGSDAWSGTLPTPNRSKTDGPFASVARARQAVREAKTQPGGPMTVAIRGGFYPLAEPLTFTADDSGTPERPITYRAYENETPQLSGGLRITGWKRTSKGVWQTQLPEVVQGQWYFSQLYVNGERRYRPRLPKAGYFRVAEEVPPTEAVRDAGDNRFRFHPGDVRADWYDAGRIEVLPFHIWSMSRLPLESVDVNERIVTLAGRTSGRVSYLAIRKGNRYLIENVREALTDPGQWYLDARSGILTYLPLPGERPDRARMIAPRLERLLVVHGARHITFEGLDFAHTGWNVPPTGNTFPQAEVNLGATIEARDADSIRLVRCRVRNTGNWAVALGGSSRNCVVESCELSDLGAGGVRIGEMAYLPDESQLAHRNTVSNCRIAHLGRMHPAAVGIWLGHSHHNRLLHNEIADLYYTAISPGWSWGYGPSGAHHNEIAFNHLHDIGQGVLSDMGGIYTLGVAPGTTLHHNRIHDIRSFDYGGWGIYYDEGSTGVVSENNLVFRTRSAPFHQHYGRENIVRNNILAFGQEAQLMRTRAEDHLSFTLSNNIVVWTEGPLLGSNWSGDRFILRDNLYWRFGQPVTFAEGMDLATWQARGFDAGSRIADPLFVAPEKGDFSLKPDSPALKMGFVPFDLSTVGPDPATVKFFGWKGPVRLAPPAFPTPPAGTSPPRGTAP